MKGLIKELLPYFPHKSLCSLSCMNGLKRNYVISYENPTLSRNLLKTYLSLHIMKNLAL